MKVFYASFILLLLSFVGFSQITQTKGISYQAVIIDPNPIELPGEDITQQPYVNKDLWVRFGIYSGTILQFEELHKTTTDQYGLVNLVIGTGASTFKSNSIAYLNWEGPTKNLVTSVSFDKGVNFKEVSNQKLTFVPYSFYAESAGKISGVLPIGQGGTGATTAVGARFNLGLGNIDNTSDADKPVSYATLTLLNGKESLINKSTDINTDSASTIKYPSVKIIKNYIDNKISSLGNLNQSISSFSAEKLTHPRTINGVPFDGTSDITIPVGITSVDADSLNKGILRLAGDLSGTANTPIIRPNSIITNKLADGSITSVKLGNNSVTNEKIVSIAGEKVVGNINGNAASATIANSAIKLQTPRTINGVAFDGTSDITINTNPSTSIGTIAIENGGTGASTSSGARTNLGLGSLSTKSSISNSDVDINASIDFSKLNINKNNITNLGIQEQLTAGAGISISSGIISASGITTSSLASNAGITNGQLQNNSITLGSTVIPLGSAVTTLSGMSSINSNNFTGELTGNASTATYSTYAGTASNTTKLSTARNINGVAFDGSSDITITTAANTLSGTTLSSNIINSNLTSVGTITSGVWSATVIGSNVGGAGSVNGILKANGSGLVSAAINGTDYLTPNSSIVGSTKTKITYDSKGLILAGTDATTADIAPSTNRNYVTDTQSGVISNTSGINTGDETTASIKNKLGILTLSGSNTGDQTISLTGDVTGSGTGTFSTTISNGSVTYSKIQNITAGKLLGSISSSDASVGAITVGSGLSLSNGTITGSGGTVTSVDPITINASGNTLTSTVLNATTTPAISLTIPLASVSGTTAGLLSNSDYLTFSGKQNALTNPVTGTGTVNYIPKWTGLTTQANSIIQDDGTRVSVGYTTNPGTNTFDVNGTGKFVGNLITNGYLGVGTTSNPISTLHVNQLAGTTKGILITGDEAYVSGNGDASNGVRIALGVNRGGNRQLWIGDNSNYGSATKGLFRYQTGEVGYVNLDATSGDGTKRLLTVLGTETSNVGIGYDGQSPNYQLYTGKLNSFVFNNDQQVNLILRRFGFAGEYLQNINTIGNIVSGFNNNGYLYLKGSTSGTVTLQPQSTTANYSLTLPNSAGSSGQLLSTDGTGNLSWTSPGLALGGGTLSGKLSFSQTNDYSAIDFNRGVSPTYVGGISVTSSQVFYNQTSDYRLKQDFKDFNALKLIDSIKVYDYEWKSDKSRSYGVKAHELQNTIPYVVHGEKDAVNSDGSIAPQSVDYSKLVPVLIKAIQELKNQNESLQIQISNLKKTKNGKKSF